MANITITEDSKGKKLVFGEYFNQSIILPEDVHTVEFGDRFNQPVILPEGVRTVTFDTYFIQLLPPPITTYFSKSTRGFYQPVSLSKFRTVRLCAARSMILPDGVHTVTFGSRFNQPVVLPEGAKVHFYNTGFNQRVLVLKP